MITPPAPSLTGSSQLDGQAMDAYASQMQMMQQKMTVDMMQQQYTNSQTQMNVSKVNAFKDIVKSVQV